MTVCGSAAVENVALSVPAETQSDHRAIKVSTFHFVVSPGVHSTSAVGDPGFYYVD